MKPRLQQNAPIIVRLILACNRAIDVLGRVGVMARDEALWAWTSQSLRGPINADLYTGSRTFYPGGETFEGGLFDWERVAIAKYFPKSGRILIGAAGAGRELKALAHLGYEVLAFEPVTAFAEAAKKVAAPHPSCTVVCASYADLVQAAETHTGPLAPQVCDKEFHAVILGWTSLSYVWDSDRDALLGAVRTLAPRARVSLSYFGPNAAGDGKLAPIRAWIRGFLRLTTGKLAKPGDSFLPWAGFYQALTPEDILSLADRTGYRAIHMSATDSSYAILEPKT